MRAPETRRKAEMYVTVRMKDGSSASYIDTAVIDDIRLNRAMLLCGRLSGGDQSGRDGRRFVIDESSHISFSWKDVSSIEIKWDGATA